MAGEQCVGGWGRFCAWAVLRTSVGFHTKASPGPDNFGDLAAVKEKQHAAAPILQQMNSVV